MNKKHINECNTDKEELQNTFVLKSIQMLFVFGWKNAVRFFLFFFSIAKHWICAFKILIKKMINCL